jgi:hypothetical protein
MTKATSHTNRSAMHSAARPVSTLSDASQASRREWRSTSTGRQLVPAEVHNSEVSAHRPMGARTRARSDAGSPRCQSAGDANAKEHSRASVRHDQSLDGRNSFPMSRSREGGRRDELARSRLQLEASDEDHGNQATDCGATRLISPRIYQWLFFIRH